MNKKKEDQKDREILDVLQHRLRSYLETKHRTLTKAAIHSKLPQTSLNYVLGENSKSGPSSLVIAKLAMNNPELDLNYIFRGTTDLSGSQKPDIFALSLTASIDRLTEALNKTDKPKTAREKRA